MPSLLLLSTEGKLIGYADVLPVSPLFLKPGLWHSENKTKKAGGGHDVGSFEAGCGLKALTYEGLCRAFPLVQAHSTPTLSTALSLFTGNSFKSELSFTCKSCALLSRRLFSSLHGRQLVSAICFSFLASRILPGLLSNNCPQSCQATTTQQSVGAMSASSLVDWLGLKAPSPQVKPTTLPLSYFKLPPASVPTTVPPPPANHHESTLAHPFTIPTNIYNDLLKPQIPITVALMYMSVVVVLNQVNANRTHKPWAISRTRFFKLFVILHNIFLAVYSACTCVGMTNAVVQSLPAWNEDWKVSKTVDALCKMHGPRGAGSAATYNETTSAWTMTNRLFHLAADGLGPETTDVGRIWNEGLAFYGWLFYLSKFYEVVDTLIILAKGRQSSLLQTYHHAGAMLCMWAGIRYMSPPIWMFVLVNSGIHAVMVSR